MLASAACSPNPNQEMSVENSSSSGSRASVKILDGNWQVAAMDDEWIVGIILNGDNGTLSWEPECAGWSRPYQQTASAIRFFGSSNPPEERRVVCSIGFPDQLPRIFDILPMLDRIDAVETRSIRLSGRGHYILLERPLPAADRAVKSLEGRWKASTLDGNKLSNQGLQFAATANSITWQPRCAGQARTYAIENDRFQAYRLPPPAPPPPPSSQGVAPAPVCVLPLHPELEIVFAAMDAATHIHPAKDGGIVIRGAGRELVLIPGKK